MFEDRVKLATTLLRFGLAFALGYVAVRSFLSPGDWIGYFPSFLRQLLPGTIILTLFSLYEIVLAALLVFNKLVFYAALLTAATMLGILVFNFAQMDVVFRDITIAASALALAALSSRR